MAQSEEWTDEAYVAAHLERADEFPHRLEGEAVLLDHLPPSAKRVLDVGCGDGRLLTKVLDHLPEARGVGLDFSDVMLAGARERFAGNDRLELVQHNLVESLPDLGTFDAVVSSMAIHHLEHERKRSLYAEIFGVINPGGVFANAEHVASPTQRLHEAFFIAIGEDAKHADPSDRTIDVESQLGWLREAGFDDVDCYWKWLEMAVLIGVRPEK